MIQMVRTTHIMKLQITLEILGFLNKDFLTRVDRKGTKLTSKMNSENTNKSVDFVNSAYGYPENNKRNKIELGMFLQTN